VGARWLCDDPDAVVAALGSDCQDVGWVVTPPPHLGPMPVRAAFRRGLHVRLLIVGPVPGGAVVQLLDVAAGPHSGGSA